MSGDVDRGESINNFTRLGTVDDLQSPEEAEEIERDDVARIAYSRADELNDLDPEHRFLRKGDLVELEFPRSEKDSIIAVFIRRIGASQCQFYTVNGKWVHFPERQVQYAIPGYMDPKMIDAIVPHLPNEEMTDELLDRSQMFDLSVPREVSAPIVTRLLEFQRESEDTYRKYASRLDRAHDILAHPTDLKFGSLYSVALKLLDKTKDEQLPLTALFTVRKALSHAGFAFGSDRRSHRLTGFLQIRSKEQVETVETVRGWLRDWQDDLAASSADPDRPHQQSDGTKNVTNFIAKAKRLIAHSRTMRESTDSGNVGPSKTHFKITDKQLAVQHSFSESFTDPDRTLIRFMESWACANLFLGLPRIEALPPLLLQATGMYRENGMLASATGFMFLQEIGVLSPYENRVRFDQHLLLPSSQHSKPLEQLMTSLLEMEDNHGFVDSMEHLRHDWKDMPVFCIDGEGAHEIDDGLSVEDAGNGQYWVHIHIANPTAFFNRDSPLARMSRHMTETIYMPERAFVMLPRWASAKHFSLANDRPCLTFSAKLSLEGEYLEHKITPAIVRNVHRVTPKDVSAAIGIQQGQGSEVVMTVGGEVPAVLSKRQWWGAQSKVAGMFKVFNEQNVELLKIMQKLAEKRQSRRKAAGGIFFDSHQPEIDVWNQSFRPGLGWDPPSRVKARFSEGDPIIQLRTQVFKSWFSTGEGVSDILVREMMLLACEISAKWSDERNIPIMYRGTVMKPDETTDAATFYERILLPATENNDGETPMHLAFEYLRHSGATVLTTEPLEHKILGLSHYSKVTSPLRRYGDMIAHWQIEAALREEASTGTSLIGSKDFRYLPFAPNNLKQLMVGIQPREGMIKRAMRYAEDCWICQLFFRAHYFGEFELPATFSAYLANSPGANVQVFPVILKENSVQAAMQRTDKHGLGDAKAGDWWEVAIDSVDVFHRVITMKPLRLLSRWEH